MGFLIKGCRCADVKRACCQMWYVKCRIGGQQLKWGTVECAHTHITRSDYLEKLVSRQKLGGGSITACFAGTKRQRSGSGSGLESLRTDPHPMRRRDTSTHNYNIV